MNKTLQFKITLKDSNPLIWRTLQVEDTYRMDRFHQVIQIVMGWQNAHLHEFSINNKSLGILLDDGFDLGETEDETKFFLKDFSLRKGGKFVYIYDFGDSWYHTLEILKVEESTDFFLRCIDGKRACPPEDCGGIYAYNELLDVIKKPSHPEYEDWIEWLGDEFDPAYFSIETINEELAKFEAWHKKYPRKKSSPWHQI